MRPARKGPENSALPAAAWRATVAASMRPARKGPENMELRLRVVPSVMRLQ